MTHDGMNYHPEAEVLRERAFETEPAGHKKGQTRETAAEFLGGALNLSSAPPEEPSPDTAPATPPAVSEIPLINEGKPCQSCSEDGCTYCRESSDYVLAA
ncbi:hypothetical protein KY385_00115 [Candidatus Parcubacteria bacterium]|nr:hypothetical protein [Candidatus Parcubacteria bacterium]